MTNDKLTIWRELRFDILFKGDDWRGTEKGGPAERDFAAVGVEVVYFPYTMSTSSSTLCRTLRDIDMMSGKDLLAMRPSIRAWTIHGRALRSQRGHNAAGGGLPSSTRSGGLPPPSLGVVTDACAISRS
jgi:hypothetical protein